MKYGRWTVIQKGNRPRHWLCKCDCGTYREVFDGTLKNGASTSCGCYLREWCSRTKTKHRMTGTPEYSAWTHIIQKCTNPKCADFPRYGGRGITVDERWKNSFSAFFAHIGKRPSNNFTIERIDNNKGYVPGNVRWATRTEQANNTRNNYQITYNGKTKNLCQWADRLGIKPQTIAYRLKSGWSVHDALTKPVRAY